MKSFVAGLLIAFALFVITSPLWLGWIQQPRVDAHRYIVPTAQAGADSVSVGIEQAARSTTYARLQQGPSDGGAVYGQSAMPAGEYPVVTMAAPVVGQINASGPGTANVEAWRQRNCEPGSKYANQYPCVTSDQSGNACQIGTCRPAEIQGLPALRGGAR
jgi:hypothetical protein